MKRKFLLLCALTAVLGQSCSGEDGVTTEKLVRTERLSNKFQDLVKSMISFNPTLNAPGKCGEHSRMASAAAENLELWALKMFDSSGKVPPSLLNGNVNQYGDFDQCLDIEHHPDDAEEAIRGQYVLAFLDLKVSGEVKNPQLKHLVALAHSNNFIRSNFSDPGHRIPRYSTLNWGICVPSACNAQDVENGLRKALEGIASIPEFTLDLKVDEAMMYKKEPPVLDLTTWFVILLFSVLVSIIALATCFDAPTEHARTGKYTRIFFAFSLRKTYKELTDMKTSADDLTSLHGLRFLNALGLLLCHKSMALFFYPFINRTDLTVRLEKPWTVIGRTAILYTDSFIVLSGLLVAYSFMKDFDKKGKIDIKSRLKARFLRITPNFAAIILFCTYILQLMGTGPQWNLVVKHYSDLCKSHMWRNFLYIHNYFGFENMCLTHTHQLGIDMQLFAISPFLVYLVWKWPRAGTTALISFAAVSTWLRYSVTYSNQLSSIIYFGKPVKKMFDTCNKSYILPSHRLTVYIMGLLTGVYLRRNPNGINFRNLFTTLLGWVFLLLVCIYPWFSPYNMSKHDYQYDVNEAAFYAAFAPILWSVFIIGLIFMCHQNRGSYVGAFMRWKGFQIFTKISYAVYLTQFPVYFYNVGTTRFAGYSNVQDIISEVLAILVASVLLTLFVDLPFQEIKKILTEKEVGASMGSRKIQAKER